jgi:hypothetical protein
VDGVINQMNYGDVLTMVETFKSGTNAVGAWSDTAPELHFASPTAYEKTQLAHFRSKARAIAGGFVYPKTAANSTDLLATVQRASDYAAPALLHKDRVNLLLVSDMMNYSNELKMTGLASIPDSAWVARRKTDGLVPDLPGVCVSVAGADVSNHTGIAVRTFWQRYFAAAGASLDRARYLTLMASPSQVLC